MLRRSKQIKKAIAGTDSLGSLSSKLSSYPDPDPCANETPQKLLTPTDWREYLNNELDLYENIYVTLDGKLNIKFRDAPRSQPDKKFAITELRFGEYVQKYTDATGFDTYAGLRSTVYYFPRGKTINDVVFKPFKLDPLCLWDGPYINDQLVHMERGYGIGNKTEAQALHHVVNYYDGYNPKDLFRKYSLYIVVELEYRVEYFAIYIP